MTNMTIITQSEFFEKLKNGEDTSIYLTKPDDWVEPVPIQDPKILKELAKISQEIIEKRILMQSSKTWATKIKYQNEIERLTAEYQKLAK